MAGSAVIADPQSQHENSSLTTIPNQRFALISLTSLFFMWGFITCLNDILIPYLKGMFDLNYTQAMLVQFCFFGAYFIVSLPAGALVSKVGYKTGIVIGLSIASLGCFLFYPAAEVARYSVFLFALFVLATGITILQVSANPYVSVLGRSETASSRLTMTQAFNSLGTTIAPFFGAWLLFNGVEHGDATDASAVKVPYIALALSFILLAALFAWLKLPELGKTAQVSISPKKAWKFKHLRLGAVGIFLYVGAEVSIGSFLVNFIAEPHISGFSESKAVTYIAYYWGGAMVGRFIGAVVMQRIAANKVLFVNGLCSIALISLAILLDGSVAMWSILAVGLFNSIMFPTIFSLAINQLKDATSHGAGVLCLAIVGGAIVPLLQGALADFIGVQSSFILPIFCYVYIIYYGVSGFKPASNLSKINEEKADELR